MKGIKKINSQTSNSLLETCSKQTWWISILCSSPLGLSLLFHPSFSHHRACVVSADALLILNQPQLKTHTTVLPLQMASKTNASSVSQGNTRPWLLVDRWGEKAMNSKGGWKKGRQLINDITMMWEKEICDGWSGCKIRLRQRTRQRGTRGACQNCKSCPPLPHQSCHPSLLQNKLEIYWLALVFVSVLQLEMKPLINLMDQLQLQPVRAEDRRKSGDNEWG